MQVHILSQSAFTLESLRDEASSPNKVRTASLVHQGEIVACSRLARSSRRHGHRGRPHSRGTSLERLSIRCTAPLALAGASCSCGDRAVGRAGTTAGWFGWLSSGGSRSSGRSCNCRGRRGLRLRRSDGRRLAREVDGSSRLCCWLSCWLSHGRGDENTARNLGSRRIRLRRLSSLRRSNNWSNHWSWCRGSDSVFHHVSHSHGSIGGGECSTYGWPAGGAAGGAAGASTAWPHSSFPGGGPGCTVPRLL